MSTEDALRDRVARASHDAYWAHSWKSEDPASASWAAWLQQTDAALAALAIPPEVLSWVSAHPEAAKRLTEGTMVAVTPEQITNLCFSAFMNSFEPNKEDGGKSDWVNDTAPLVKRWIERLAASTPVTSDEAQDTYIAGLPPEEGGGSLAER